jgi:hypothetical protein
LGSGIIIAPLFVEPSERGSVTELLIISLGLCVLSTVSYLIFGRPYADIGHGRVRVRNPFSVNIIELACIDALSRTFDGRVRISAGDRLVTVWGVQQNLRERLGGYSEEVKVILAEARACGAVPRLEGAPEASPRFWEQLDETAKSIAECRGYAAAPAPRGENSSKCIVFDLNFALLLISWTSYWLWIVVALIAS